MLLALLLLGSTVQLVDEIYEIPPAEWRFVDVAMNQRPARVTCSFQVTPAPAQAKLALIRAEDLKQFRTGTAFVPVFQSGPASSGSFSVTPRNAGEYAVVVDNRQGAAPVQVALRIALDFGPRTAVRYADPRRQLAVILASFAMFFAAVSYSARRLLAATRRR